jgi:hypothetical protein
MGATFPLLLQQPCLLLVLAGVVQAVLLQKLGTGMQALPVEQAGSALVVVALLGLGKMTIQLLPLLTAQMAGLVLL